jgi:L-threonylcarbamoyladenylate synthase
MLWWKSRIAGHILRRGGIIAYPTEAVWGLGCLPENRKAVDRILSLKRRPAHKGLILVAASMDQLSDYLEGLTENERKLLSDSWPGPVSWLIPDNGHAPVWVKGLNDTLAVRVSDHPIVKSICNEVQSAIISTSANLAGRAPITSALRVRSLFGDSVDYIHPGELGKSRKPTEIRHLQLGHIVRQG